MTGSQVTSGATASSTADALSACLRWLRSRSATITRYPAGLPSTPEALQVFLVRPETGDARFEFAETCDLASLGLRCCQQRDSLANHHRRAHAESIHEARQGLFGVVVK